MSGSMTAADLQSLFAELRASGAFAIDTRHYLNAYQLLEVQAQHGQAAISRDKWCSLLAPIVCRSADEQRQFPRYFHQWLNGHSQPTGQTPPGAVELTSTSSGSKPWKSWYSVLIAAVVALVVALVLWLAPEKEDKSTIDPPPAVNDDPEQSPLFQDNGFILVAGIGLVGWLIVAQWRRSRRYNAWLQQGDLQQLISLEHLPVERLKYHYYRTHAVRRFIRQFRRHKVVQTSELDGEKTARSAARKVGFIQPMYLQRQVSPEYLVLIDVSSSGGHVARLFEQIANSLKLDGTVIDQYYFFTDPRNCFADRAGHYSISLASLAGQHRDARLLVFSKGDGLVQKRNGQVKTWVADVFNAWPIRCLITPKTTPPWGNAERAIIMSRFVLVPAHQQGLSGLAAWLENLALPERQQVPAKPHQPEPPEPFPSSLLDDESRWLLNDVASHEQVETLITQLRLYLGTFGFQWLCACSVFPKLLWDISSYLGLWLDRTYPQQESLEDCFIRLACLPWFRQGYIPDYLRVRLMAELQGPQQLAIRQALEVLLDEALRRPDTNEPLPIGVPLDAEKRRFLADTLARLPDNEELKDGLLLSFMQGKLPQPTDYQLSDKVTKLLSPKTTGLSRRWLPLVRDLALPLGLWLFAAALFAGLTPFSSALNNVLKQAWYANWLSPLLVLVAAVLFCRLLLRWTHAIQGQSKALAWFDRGLNIGTWSFSWPGFNMLSLAMVPLVMLLLDQIVELAPLAAATESGAPAQKGANYGLEQIAVTTIPSYARNGSASANLLFAMALLYLVLPLRMPRQMLSLHTLPGQFLSALPLPSLARFLPFLLLFSVSVAGHLLSNFAMESLYEQDWLPLWLPNWLIERGAYGFQLFTMLLVPCWWIFRGAQPPALNPTTLAWRLAITATAAQSLALALTIPLHSSVAEFTIDWLSGQELDELALKIDSAVSSLLSIPSVWLPVLMLSVTLIAQLQAGGRLAASVLSNQRALKWLIGFYTFVVVGLHLMLNKDFEGLNALTDSWYWLSLAVFVVLLLKVHQAKSLASLWQLLKRTPVHSTLLLLLYLPLLVVLLLLFDQLANYGYFPLTFSALYASSGLLLLYLAVRGWCAPLNTLMKEPAPQVSTSLKALSQRHYWLLGLMALHIGYAEFDLSLTLLALLLIPRWALQGLYISRRLVTGLLILAAGGLSLYIETSDDYAYFSLGPDIFYLSCGFLLYGFITYPQRLAGLLQQSRLTRSAYWLLSLCLLTSPVLYWDISESFYVAVGYWSALLFMLLLLLVGVTAISLGRGIMLVAACSLLSILQKLHNEDSEALTDNITIYFTRYDTALPQLLLVSLFCYWGGRLLRNWLLHSHEQPKRRLRARVWSSMTLALIGLNPLLLAQEQATMSQESLSQDLQQLLLVGPQSQYITTPTLFALYLSCLLLPILNGRLRGGILLGCVGLSIALRIGLGWDSWDTWQSALLPMLVFAVLGWRIAPHRQSINRAIMPFLATSDIEELKHSSVSTRITRQAISPFDWLQQYSLPLRVLGIIAMLIFTLVTGSQLNAFLQILM